MEEVFPYSLSIYLAALCLLVWSFLFIWLCNVLLLEPRKIRLKLRRQGIKGPPPSFVMGNIPEMKTITSMSSKAPATEAHQLPLNFCSSTIFPYFTQWTKQYGGVFTFALGNVQVLYVTDTKLVRELNLSKSLDLGKPAYLQEDRGPLLGKGLITSNGEVWLHQRKTIAPQLYVEKVKGKLNIMVEAATELVRSWQNLIEHGGGTADIRVDDYIRSFTSSVISKIMFGNHYSKGVKLFPKCRALMKTLQSPTMLKGLPFLRFLPTNGNRDAWRLEGEIYSAIIELAKGHPEASSDQMAKIITESAKTGALGSSKPDQYIVDNCKDVYLAAFEVTAVASLWGLVLLASNPEWQARLRNEIIEVCGGHLPDISMLGKMKVLKMVIQEVLRLYPGVAFVSRQALKDVNLGDITVPKGVNIWIWTPALHQDPEFWGSDAEKFNPERFANGVSGACKSPNAYIPFGVGTRMCPGQNLAITEMKILFILILSHFSLSISSSYCHSPSLNLLLEPKNGVNLIIRKI